MSQQYGYYHSVETFGTVDGRGIRYVLFLAGCSLGCKFCHNPDTWVRGEKTISVEAVMADIRKYRRYYEASGGGITISGGEALLQPDFVAEVFRQCREKKVHTTLDTAGNCPEESLDRVLPYTDAVLFSIKAVDPVKHRWLTGSDNSKILANLKKVSEVLPVALRYVVIPGITNGRDDIDALAAMIKSLPGQVAVELLPYHTFGRKKWAQLGKAYLLEGVPDATPQDIAKVQALLKEHDIDVLYETKAG
ncbi:pyruvate formate-lyase-activating protein [Sporomusa malonica]|uniref:Pyruvate formate-lyase-activating enzyme n=1 Tax=Sporomusa malonica TaxID=112901 RepID=A0A1W1YHU6_9FIRM|nr:pyruvate formate-lyase-activating protein [Sporomusa malonica]SMC35696.1 pyruvate formate lyase activating enzyme [Sporomusa malonica]